MGKGRSTPPGPIWAPLQPPLNWCRSPGESAPGHSERRSAIPRSRRAYASLPSAQGPLGGV
eukprot:5143268-Alexandrium_andersonii.AAC.1